MRPTTDASPISGARILRGDDGVQTVVATASMIVPRPGDCADYDAIADGYAELGRVARAAGVERFVFMSARAS